MATATIDRREQLREQTVKNRELMALGDLDPSQEAALVEGMARVKSLMNVIKAEGDQEEIEEFLKSSKGGMNLGEPGSTKAEVEDIVPEHEETVERARVTLSGKEYDRFKIYDEHPLMDRKTFEKISATEYKLAFKSYLRRGKENMTREELKFLQEGNDTAGGYLVPEDVLGAIIAKKPTPTSVAGKVRQLTTNRDVLVIPRVNYTADDLYTTGIRATWTGENPSSATQARVTDPVFGQTRIQVYTAMLSLPLTNDMIEDTSFPLVQWIAEKFGETIELLKDNMVINGSGIGQPMGILANPAGTGQPAVITSGVSNNITPDSLESLAFALPPQYDENSAYLFNKLSTAKTIAQMKDSQGRYLWGAGLQDSGMVPGWKDRKLWGYDVQYSEFMPNIGTSTYPVIFGDLTGYYLLNRVGFSIKILTETYAESNQIVVLGRIRFGGQVAEDWKIKTLQCHV